MLYDRILGKIFGFVMKSDLFFIILWDIFIVADVAAESAANNLVEDLVSYEDDESPSQHHPAQGEEHEGDHIQ